MAFRRRRVPPNPIQSLGVPGGLVRWGEITTAVSGVRPPRVVPFGDLEIVFLNEKVQYEAPTELSPTFCEKVGKTWGEN